MMPQTFETYIESEKRRLADDKEAALTALKEAQDKLTAIETEMTAIAAYEAAKKGKPVVAPTGEKKPRKPRETGKRQEIFALLQTFPEGATRRQLIDKLNIGDDKKGQNSLSMALTALKKQGQVTQAEGRNAPYIVVTPA